MSGLLPIADVVAKNREHLLGQQLQLEQQQFERLKHDFSYNLSLLRERDTELERYDMEAAALRGQLDQRDAGLQEAQRGIEELESQAATAASKASAMLAAIAEADKQARDHREREQRRTAELHRVEEELEETRRQRDEARKEGTRASNAGAEAKQEAISVRNELGMRLHAAQQELAEAEEGCRRAVQEERAQLEARLKANRSEQQRHTASLQEQVERLHAELAEAGRAHEATHEEVQAMRDAHANEALQRQRQKAELQRAAAAAEEKQQEVLRLGKKVELAELAARQKQAVVEEEAEAVREEHVQQMAAAARVAAAREEDIKRAAADEMEAARSEAAQRELELEAVIERGAAKLRQVQAAVQAAEERVRAQGQRAEQLQVEKHSLQREASSLRSEASTCREKAEMLQAMLSQRTEYLHEVQTAAAEREEQLQAHFAEQHGLAVGELQARLETEAQNGSSLARQLAAARELHERAEVQCQTLQQRLLAVESHDLASGLAAPLPSVAPLPVFEEQVSSPPLPPPPPHDMQQQQQQQQQQQYVQWQLQQEQQQQPWAAPSLFADLGRRADPPPPVPQAPRVQLGQGSAFALSALGQPEPHAAPLFRSPQRVDEEAIRSRLRSPPTAGQR